MTFITTAYSLPPHCSVWRSVLAFPQILHTGHICLLLVFVRLFSSKCFLWSLPGSSCSPPPSHLKWFSRIYDSQLWNKYKYFYSSKKKYSSFQFSLYHQHNFFLSHYHQMSKSEQNMLQPPSISSPKPLCISLMAMLANSPTIPSTGPACQNSCWQICPSPL